MRYVLVQVIALMVLVNASMAFGAAERVEVAIKFGDCGDFDFKAAQDGTAKCGIVAYNLEHASRFEIKHGKLIIEVAKDSRWWNWRDTKRNAPYAVLEKRLPIDEREPYPAEFKSKGTLEITTVSSGEGNLFLIFSDSLGIPGDGNSQVFEGSGGGVGIGELYAGNRLGKMTGSGGSLRRTLKTLEARMDGANSTITATYTSGDSISWGHYGAVQLACWNDYGVKYDRRIRMSFGLSGGPYSEGVERMELSGVSFEATSR